MTELKVTALRNAARMAAATAQFTLPDQNVGNTKGVISYNFVSNHKVELRKVYTIGAKSADDSYSGPPRTVVGLTGVRTPDSDTGASLNKPDTALDVKTIKNGTISGGVLNGKAVNLAKPAYPAAAKAVRAGGMVAVQVLIDEGGNVNSAAAVSGHPLLRRATEVAACGSSFSPTILQGHPVKVLGVITYNFVP